MRTFELLRLVGQNINQNKFKSIMTSIGIVVGAATIVLVIGVGRGGQMEIAEQFAGLNAGAINVTYEKEGEDEKSGGSSIFGMFGGNMPFGGGMPGGPPSFGGNMPDFGNMPGGGNRPDRDDSESGSRSDRGNAEGSDRQERPDAQSDDASSETEESETSLIEDRLNQEDLILSQDDIDDIERYVSGISGAAISYSTKASVEGGNMTEAQTYTAAGVKANFAEVSKLALREGEFISQEDDDLKNRVCVLGATAAKEMFGNSDEIVGSTIFIEERSYQVIGVLAEFGSVASKISPDTTVFVPYQTGIKYITGREIDPVLTVIAEDVNVLDSVIEKVRIVLEENYPNASFSFEDSGSKMQAAKASNRTLTMLLSAMAVIVFFVGGIGIMNVLFVSIKERTNEIGILKAIGMQRGTILAEFLMESAAISFMGGVLGCILSFVIVPLANRFGVRVETNLTAFLAALGFSVLTGTIFGIYPAWKASRMEPVDALNAE